MRARGRNDITLLAGLAIAALIIFQRPIGQFFQVGRDIEEQYGLALVPGLVILAVVFLGNILVGRIRSAAARRRDAEMVSALALGQALSRATSMDGVRDVLRNQLPAAANAPGAWLVTRTEGQWRALVGRARRDPGWVPSRPSQTASLQRPPRRLMTPGAVRSTGTSVFA